MGVTPDAEVTPDMGRNTGLQIIHSAKTQGRLVSALVGSNQVKYIFLFLNSELCPCITQCPKLPPHLPYCLVVDSVPSIPDQ